MLHGIGEGLIHLHVIRQIGLGCPLEGGIQIKFIAAFNVLHFDVSSFDSLQNHLHALFQLGEILAVRTQHQLGVGGAAELEHQIHAAGEPGIKIIVRPTHSLQICVARVGGIIDGGDAGIIEPVDHDEIPQGLGFQAIRPQGIDHLLHIVDVFVDIVGVVVLLRLGPRHCVGGGINPELHQLIAYGSGCIIDPSIGKNLRMGASGAGESRGQQAQSGYSRINGAHFCCFACMIRQHHLILLYLIEDWSVAFKRLHKG
ncbi:hypothetical protein D3C75_447600 [compost metagenome]